MDLENLILSEFEFAVIRLAAIEKIDQPGQLLFASVSFITSDRPKPVSMLSVDRRQVKKSSSNIVFRRTVLTAHDALRWYKDIGICSNLSPIPSYEDERNDKYDGKSLIIPKLFESPPWPYVGLPIHEGLLSHSTDRIHPAPFVGLSSARVHRKFSNSTLGDEYPLIDQVVSEFLERRIHFNLKDYPEYLGSIVLIVPDPIISSIDNFLIPSDKNEGERILIRVIPRPNKITENLKLFTFEESGLLLTNFEQHDLNENGMVVLRNNNPSGRHGYIISHDSYGILAYHSPTGYVRGFNFSITTESITQIKAVAPISNSKRSKQIEYFGPGNSDKPRYRTVGESREEEFNPNSRILMAESRRKLKAQAEHYGQKWFPSGSREQAMRFFHAELKKANDRVVIIDPYMGALQIDQYLYAIRGGSLNVRIFTTKLAFQDQDHTKEKFGENILSLRSILKVSFDVYILPDSLIHDRFLIVDNTVWFVGNSLNSIGYQASMVVKIPNPFELIDMLEDFTALGESLPIFENASGLNADDEI